MDERNTHNVVNITDAEIKGKGKRGRPRKDPTNDDFSESKTETRKKKALVWVDQQRWILNSLDRIISMNVAFHKVSKEPDISPAIYLDEFKEPQIVNIDPKQNICEHIPFSFLKSAIAKYVYYLSTLKDDHPELAEMAWTERQIKSCAEYWILNTIPLGAKPKAWAFKSDSNLTFLRHKFDPDINHPRPKWLAMTKRFSCADSVRKFLASAIVHGSYNQQYLYIHGDGGDGKGCLARFIEKLFGSEYFGLQEPPKDKFFGTPFAGKRVVCFTDLRKPEFLQSPVVMGITGGDTLQLEKKGKDVINVKITAKLIFMSNLPPVISLTAHDLRRILYTRLENPTAEERMADSERYERELWEEAPGIIAECLEAYYRDCPNNEPIKQPDAIIEQIKEFAIDPLGDEFGEFAYHRFTFHPTIPGKKKTERCFVTAKTIEFILKQEWPNDHLTYQKRFKKWLTETKDVHCTTKKLCGVPVKAYFGLGLKGGIKTEKDEWVYSHPW